MHAKLRSRASTGSQGLLLVKVPGVARNTKGTLASIPQALVQSIRHGQARATQQPIICQNGVDQALTEL